MLSVIAFLYLTSFMYWSSSRAKHQSRWPAHLLKCFLVWENIKSADNLTKLGLITSWSIHSTRFHPPFPHAYCAERYCTVYIVLYCWYKIQNLQNRGGSRFSLSCYLRQSLPVSLSLSLSSLCVAGKFAYPSQQGRRGHGSKSYEWYPSLYS